MIILKEDGYIKGKCFYVQIKGSDKPKYIQEKEYLSHKFNTSTLNFLLSLNAPSMICVCDTNDPGRPIYWCWLIDAIRCAETETPMWHDQRTASLRLSTSSTFDRDEDLHKKIEEHVKRYYSELAINNQIGCIFGEQIGLDNEQFFPHSPDIEDTMRLKVYPYLYSLGVIGSPAGEIGKIKALSINDRALLDEIKAISILLNALNDREAEKRLKKLWRKARKASKIVRAKYYNNFGVLALHNNEMRKAKKAFTLAIKYEPKASKQLMNLLFTEYAIAINKGKSLRYLPSEWERKLDRILRTEKDNPNAVGLKALFIASTRSAGEAIAYIKSSNVWGKKDIQPYIIQGEIYKREAQFKNIISLFEKIEHKPVSKDERYWAIYGDAYFSRGIGVKSVGSTISLRGPGPASLNAVDLIKAEGFYEKAFQLFKEKGFPQLSEQTIVNYSVTLSLLGNFQKCISICEQFMSYHPDSILVIENLISSLNFQDGIASRTKSVRLAKHAYSINPHSPNVFNNLVLSLFCAEEYIELVKVIQARAKKGFIDTEEEGQSRSLLAISYNELGRQDLSDQELRELQGNPQLIVDAILTESEILHRRFRTKEAVGLLRKTLQDYRDERVIAKLLRFLIPVNKHNANEILQLLASLSELRQLTPDELSFWGKAYLEVNMPENAYQVLYQAAKRYPDDLRFRYLEAIAMFEMGDEANAFNFLLAYIQESPKRYDLLRNIALLAKNIGKLEESISFAEKAIHLTDDEKNKAEIHCLLYELKKRLNRSPKEILFHVNEYGKLAKSNVEEEARYLIMFFLAPSAGKPEDDIELSEWIKEFNKRLTDFSEANPNYQALKTIKFPEKLSPEEQARYLLSTLAYLSLQERLRLEPLQMAIESQPWPLTLRAQFLPGFRSLFDYWTHCNNSNEYAHAIHIWRNANDLNMETQAAKGKKVCIDINALLTLAEFDSLNLLTSVFNQVIMAKDTIQCLDIEGCSFFGPHYLAKKIDKWRTDNLDKIRVRSLKQTDLITADNSTQSRIYFPMKKTLDEVIGFGVGASILLAKDLGLPLYSDDSLMREWAISNHGVNSFSTLGLISRLKNEGRFSLHNETIIYSEMIRKNFRIIPFQASHLSSALNMLVENRKLKQLPRATSNDLISDAVLGSFLKQFGDQKLNALMLANIAISWWILVLRGSQEVRSLIEDCMQYINFCLSQRTISGILGGIKKDEDVKNVASVWAAFLWNCNLDEQDLNNLAWNAIKGSCKRLFEGNERKQNYILFTLLPLLIYEAVKRDARLTKEQKVRKLQELTQKCFKYGERDKEPLESALAKLAIKTPL
jgi:predicted nucleic acid-binding protein/Flp pilus assembly protein TadD